VRRKQLEDEAEAEEYSAAPPAHFGEKISGLANSDKGVRGGTGATKARGESTAFSALKQNRQHYDDAVEDEQG
jgi:hypothetical protein